MSQALFGFLGVIIGAVITSAFGFWRFREEMRQARIRERRESIAAVQDALYAATNHVQLLSDLFRLNDENARQEYRSFRIVVNHLLVLNQRLTNQHLMELMTPYADHAAKSANAARRHETERYWSEFEAMRAAHDELNDELMKLWVSAEMMYQPTWRKWIDSALQHLRRRK